jgi:hypothetical protein
MITTYTGRDADSFHYRTSNEVVDSSLMTPEVDQGNIIEDQGVIDQRLVGFSC